jgi:hypothetical protein
MFKKTWKHIKLLLILIITIAVFPRSFLPKRTSDLQKNGFEYYQELNDSETRLINYKDNKEALKLKISQLEIINNSRSMYDAEPVKLNILASRVANKMCVEASENQFVGHWNLAGEKPYHRYGLAGGYDHVSENAFGEWSSDNYDPSTSNIGTMMKSGHQTFMDEMPPYDGHKITIIEKSHNFVGIGFNLSGNQFRYYEEFIDRYFEFENIPKEVKINQQSSITVKTNKDDFLYYLIIYREKYPQPMKGSQIMKKGSYEDYTNEEYIKLPAWELSSYKSGSTYNIPLKFSKEGLYYIHIYSDKKEITQPTSISTKGKTSGSGIVIKVVK